MALASTLTDVADLLSPTNGSGGPAVRVVTGTLHRVHGGYVKRFVAEPPPGPVRRPARVALMLAPSGVGPARARAPLRVFARSGGARLDGAEDHGAIELGAAVLALEERKLGVVTIAKLTAAGSISGASFHIPDAVWMESIGDTDEEPLLVEVRMWWQRDDGRKFWKRVLLEKRSMIVHTHKFTEVMHHDNW